LLKNDEDILPLSRSDNLKVFGTDAGGNPDGLNSCTDMGCNKGVLTMGWGSGTARLPYLITPEQAIANVTDNVEFHITDSFPSDITANSSDIAIVFINADSGENYITVDGNPGDRTNAGLNAWHNGDDLVKAAAKKFSNVVVIIHTVGPILMEEWVDLVSVKAVVVAHLPGQEAGNSLTDVLFGDYSPSGHMPYTIPKSEDDYPESVGIINQPFGQIQDTFTEGLYIDYRHFMKANVTPRYHFGHGLSYTTFNFSQPSISVVTPLDTAYPAARPTKPSTPTYSNSIPAASEVAWSSTTFTRIWRYLYPYLDNPGSITATDKYPYPDGYSTKPHAVPRAGGGQGGNPALFETAFSVQVQVQNTGKRTGKAVAQLYVEIPSSIGLDTPELQLRQFEKTKELAPGQSETLTLHITRKDVSVWDVDVQDWKAPVNGQGIKIWVGNSVADLPVLCTVGGSCSVE
jgi:beta-glucosidase